MRKKSFVILFLLDKRALQDNLCRLQAAEWRFLPIMCEELVVAHCSPTIAGLKTGNLFTCPMEDRETLSESIRQLIYKSAIPVRYGRE